MLSLPTGSFTDLSFPVEYAEEFDYTEEALPSAMEEVATFVSKVYATFPRLEGEERKQLKERGVWIDEVTEFPSESECRQFEQALKQKILDVFNRKRVGRFSLSLSTNYYPEGDLKEVCESVFKKNSELGPLFPYKTRTKISLEPKMKKLCLDMDYKGSPF